MRGFISGLIWGSVVMGLMLATVSLIAPLAPRPEVTSDMPAPATNQSPTRAAEVSPPGADADLVDTRPSAPPATAGEDVARTAGPSGDPTVSADQPRVDPAPEQPIAGPGLSGTPDMTELAARSDDPADPAQLAPSDVPSKAPEVDTATAPHVPRVAPGPVAAPEPEMADTAIAALAPEASVVAAEPDFLAEPGSDSAPTISRQSATVPAELSAPEGATSEPRDSPAPRIAAAVAPAHGTDVVAAPAPPQDADAEPDVSRAPAEAPQPRTARAEKPEEMAEPVPANPAAASPAPAEPAPDIATDSPEPNDPGLPVIRPAPTPDPDPAPDARIAELPQAGQGDSALAPRIGQLVVPLTERSNTAETTTVPNMVEEPVADTDAPAIARHAAPFDNPEDKPLMSIVLIDDPRAIGLEALRDFPYPLTFAVDPLDPEGPARMARHRANGFEVVVLVNLPQAATAQDVEVTLSASLNVLPDTVALLEGQASGFQGNRGLSDQVSAVAQATGRGMITQGNGLNTVQKLALRSGVPALPVFRDFDGAGQTPTVMRRFLDQAAFRARQEGGVIMLGRVRPDTISALLLWGLQDRANRVALAPVSAVLQSAVKEAR